MARSGDTFGKWTIVERIDSGGQGSVYRATGSEGEPDVAIKIVKVGRVKKRARFLQEIAAQKRLTEQMSANVIPLIHSNFDELEDDVLSGFLVMPLAALSLEAALPTIRGRCELALELFLGVCLGVRSAHSEGIVHRDLKPANILFLESSLRTPLVADFGICLLKETPDASRLTDDGETVGAKYFMAPEQERGGVAAVTETADIYALGKLLHHMLTSRNIYREELDGAFTSNELASDSRFQRIQDEIIQRTVVHDPSSRMQSVDELIEVATAILGKSAPPAAKVDQSEQRVGSKVAEPEADSTSGSVQAHYRAFMHLSERTGSASYILALDDMIREVRANWDTLYEAIKEHPEVAPDAARRLVEMQSQAVGLSLALGRSNSVALFPGFRRFVESLLRDGDGPRSGDPRVFGVPHVLAGFLYMAASVQALNCESWDVLRLLLNEKFEWYYRSHRPLHSFGFNLSYLFHPEALGRESSKTHDLYRELLKEPRLADTLNLHGDALLDKYLQTQVLFCLRTAQECEQGNDVRIWPDYGRFYATRIRALFDRAFNSSTFGEGLAKTFGETRDAFFARLNDRLAFIAQRFWSGSGYSWESLVRWSPLASLR